MKNAVIFVDATQSYPKRFSAGNSKVEFIARGLIDQGYYVATINPVAGDPACTAIERGTANGIDYCIFPQQGNKLFASIKNLRAFYKELKQKRQPGADNFMVIDYAIYPYFLIDVLFAKLLGYRMMAISHEWHAALEQSFGKRIFSKIFDKTFGYFTVGILPISQYLEDKVAHFGKPMLRIPTLADFSVQPQGDAQQGNYFLFCGHARFFRLIIVMLEAFELYRTKGGTRNLTLVLGGDESDVAKVQDYIDEKSLTSSAIIKTKLPYPVLLEHYHNAIALLLPLSPESIQDQARFSQKVAEYLSVKRPIITVNVGEIRHYFKDMETAYIANDLTAEAFAQQFKRAEEDPEKADTIGQKGFDLGKKHFDYKSNGKALHEFLTKI